MIDSIIDDAWTDAAAAAAAVVSAQSGAGDFRNLVDNFDLHDSKTGSIPDSGQT